MNAGGSLHRASRSAAVVLLAIAGISIGIAVISVAGAQRAAARESVTLVAPDTLRDGAVVRVILADHIERPVAARLCNTDSRLAPGRACGNAHPPTLDGVFDVRLETGLIGSGDPRAVCPAIAPLNTPDALCVIKVSTESGSEFVAADIVTVDQVITVEVHQEGPPTTAGSTIPTSTTTTTAPPPATAVGLPPVSTAPIDAAGASTTGGGQRAPANGDGQTGAAPLAQTGSADSLAWALLGVAMLDLGWLLCSAVRPPRGAASLTMFGAVPR